MRCVCCNSPKAKWDGYDYYCDKCKAIIDESLAEWEEGEGDSIIGPYAEDVE